MPSPSVPISDPSMLGQTKYPRHPLDFYPTPERAVTAFARHPLIQQNLLQGRTIWEPACGDGAIVKALAPHVEKVVASDIRAYPGFDPDFLQDFLAIGDLAEVFDGDLRRPWPDTIITNPPYGDEAELFARHALELLRPYGGSLALLCRHEWDAAKGRADIFDDESFAAKVTLRFRPRWIADSKGAPRFSYAWYCWDLDPTCPDHPLSLYAA